MKQQRVLFAIVTMALPAWRPAEAQSLAKLEAVRKPVSIPYSEQAAQMGGVFQDLFIRVPPGVDQAKIELHLARAGEGEAALRVRYPCQPGIVTGSSNGLSAMPRNRPSLTLKSSRSPASSTNPSPYGNCRNWNQRPPLPR